MESELVDYQRRELGGTHVRRPRLAVTYEGGDSDFLSRVLDVVDLVEVTPDSIALLTGSGAHLDPATLSALSDACRKVELLVHGIGLSIGSHGGCSDRYLSLLDQMFAASLPIAWHSEHLAYTEVDGESLGTMLALPRTRGVLDMICDRVAWIQDRYDAPFLMENAVHLLPDAASDYTDAGFLNELTRRTGCGLILDVYNLECDATNCGTDIPAFLSELDLRAVREVHLAGGTEHRGFRLDVHSRLTSKSTVDLAAGVIERAAGAVQAVTYEVLREAVPILGHDAIVGELQRLSQALCGTDARLAIETA